MKTNAPFQLTAKASEDLDAIWWIIAEESRAAAERVEVVAILHGKRDLKEILEKRS
jgi:plasmid stabilization system protein ParE